MITSLNSFKDPVFIPQTVKYNHRKSRKTLDFTACMVVSALICG